MRILLFITLLMLVSCGGNKSPSANFNVPQAEMEEVDPGFEKAIEQHLDIQDHTLQALNAPSAAKLNSAFHLGAVMFDLGVSVKGVLGQLVGKGSSAVTLIWKKNLPRSIVDQGEDASSVPSIALNKAAWNESVAREFCQQNACTETGKPSPEVLRHVQGLWDWSNVGSELSNRHPWKMERVRLDLQVDASGNVITDWTPVSIKAAAKLRLEWKQRSNGLAKAMTPPSPMQMKLLFEIMDSLPLLDREIRREEKLGFELKTVKIGLGLNVTGEWELVKPGITPTLYIYLKPLPQNNFVPIHPRARVTFPGFQRAGRMARYFLRTAHRYVPVASDWALTDLKIGFDMYSKRTFTLTSVNATTGMELHFTKKKAL